MKRALFPWVLLFLGSELGGPAGSSYLWRQQSSSLLREAFVSRRQAEPADKLDSTPCADNLELHKAIHRELNDCSWLARQGIPNTGATRLRGGSSQYGTYNTPITFFSNNGHIAQIEYALEAVKKGLTVVAIKGEHVICIGVERRAVAKLQDPTTVRKLHQVDAHIVAATAGVAADARVLIDQARVESLTYRLQYEDCPSVEYVARYVGDVMLQYTMTRGTRPFGTSVVMAGFDQLSKTRLRPEVKPYPVPRVFLVDPSGCMVEWKAVSIGRSSKTINDYLERNYPASRQLVEGKDVQAEERILCELVMASMMEVMKVRHTSVEIATLTAARGVRLLLDEEVDLMAEGIDGGLEANATRTDEDSDWHPARAD